MVNRLHVRTWGEGPRVALLVHGITNDSTTWWELGPELARRGYRALAPDLPGHGDSDRTSPYSVESMRDALLETITETPEVAIGHSLGALVLASAVDKMGPARVIYLDPAWGASEGDAMARYLRTEKDVTAEQMAAGLPQWAAQSRAYKLGATSRWDTDTLALTIDFPGYDPGPAVRPSLVVTAGRDSPVTAEQVRRLAGNGYEVRSMPGAGHVVQSEDFPGLLEALDAWV